MVPPKRIEKETGTVVFAPPILRCGWLMGPHYYRHPEPAGPDPDPDSFEPNVKIIYTLFREFPHIVQNIENYDTYDADKKDINKLCCE